MRNILGDNFLKNIYISELLKFNEVAKSEKPMKKAAKGKSKPDVEKPMQKAAVKGKVKPDVVKLEKSKDGLKAKKTTMVAKDESGGGLKPKRKSVLRK